MSDSAVTHDVLLERLGVLANESLDLWDLPAGATARLINVSENATYLIEATGDFKSVLRIHRENYHTRNAISCEHAWSNALNEEGGVRTPAILAGRDGSTIQTSRVVMKEVTGPLLMPGVVSAGLFAFLLSWGNFPLSLFTTGADSTLPEWLYAKMVSGYSPLVPTVGILSIATSIMLLLIAFVIPWLIRGVRERRVRAS